MTPLVVGNWKMHGTIEETLKLINELTHRLGKLSGVEIAVAPPFTSLYSAQIVLQETAIKLAAQDMHWEIEGAYTGEVSGAFLKEIGCTFVIIGHSERRHLFGEDDTTINKKLCAALAAELTPIFCIGETEKEREEGKMEEVLQRQIKRGLQELHMNDLRGIVIAYEPVWAIGTGQNATAEQIEEAHAWIRNYIAKTFDAPTANSIPLLYGGSVKPENTREIAAVKNVEGLLVGGASLSPEKFYNILKAVSEVS